MTIATAHCSGIPVKARLPGLRKMTRSTTSTRKPANQIRDIDQQSDKTAADAGQGHLDVHQFRRVDVKLVWVKLI